MPQIFTTFEEVQCQDKGKIELRKEQLDAIKDAKNRFKQKAGNKFLWNAKMRFGKTVCALQLAKELGYRRILIVTHRPTVNKEWLEAYEERFSDVISQYSYGTKSDTQSEGTDFYTLKRKISETKNSHFLFFASMQYLRRSNLVGGDNKEQLKKDIMTYDWDLVIVDEAHEGTRTELGQRVLEYLEHKTTLSKDEKDTRMLHLSGTPFNLYEDFKNNEIYTWDYVDEQTAKNTWYDDPAHEGLPNPYAVLPHMNILTFSLASVFDKFIEEGGTFKFRDFFRTKTGSDIPEDERGKFVHEEEVREFIAKLRGKDDDNNFPFSNDEFRKAFRHTLWIVPGVKEAKALKKLLKQDKVFSRFEVVNVAGNNDDESKDSALDAVLSAITDQPDQTRTITLSCGKLTTGTTVKPWTAVLYLKGSEDTKAATYMQTIFRVQSPCFMGNKMKTECYVFDFDYQRTLKVVAETAKYSTIAKKASNKDEVKELTQDELDKKNMKAFLDCCNVKPLVPFTEDGAVMTEFNVESIFKRLESVYVDRLVTSGFNDKCLYDMTELNKIDKSIIDNIGDNGGAADHIEGDKRVKGVGEAIDANNLTEEQKKAIEEAKKKLRKEMEEKRKEKWDALTQEEQDKILEERARRAMERKEFKDRVSNIRGISLRIPLLMFGGADKGNTKTPLTVDNFTELISDESWNEFMPKGISKNDFKKIRKVFKATRFEEAGKKYRALAIEADDMHIDDRMDRITTIHSWFKNPDKETVLTPWNVVNMHLHTALGGYSFFDPQDYKSPVMKEAPVKDDNGNVVLDDNGNVKTEPIEIAVTEQPAYRDGITNEVFGTYDSGKDAIQTRILEINSKTGLYPLYMAYSLYRLQMDAYIREKAYDDIDNLSVDEEQATWDNVIKNNIFVICNTKMAAQITFRTLMGFRNEDKGQHHIKTTNLVERASNDKERTFLVENLKSGTFWDLDIETMNFNAVVGNPPYQGSARVQLYPTFYQLAIQLGDIATLIFPTGWQKPCAPTAKGLYKMNNPETKADKQIVFLDNRHNVFPGISGANEINIILWKHGFDNGYDGKQLLLTDGEAPQLVQLQWIQTNEGKPVEIQAAAEAVKQVEGDNFKSVSDIVSAKDPFGIPTDLFTKPTKYGKSPSDFKEEKQTESDIRIFGGIDHKRAERYVSSDFSMKSNDSISKYKVFVPWAWGNMDENAGLGGAYADIIIAEKNDVCSMTYNTCGQYEDYDTAKKQAKYMMTTFFRGLLFNSKDVKTSSKTAYSSIPVQSFEEEWWNESIEIIDKKLFEKYGILELYKFFKGNIQFKNEANIDNFK
ncbi:MAG: DEAD/DEAH box helicase family protein [Prevotella sp.]|nr:DEAD/DEAH box helicase family protein [Prevotella sp.]